MCTACWDLACWDLAHWDSASWEPVCWECWAPACWACWDRACWTSWDLECCAQPVGTLYAGTWCAGTWCAGTWNPANLQLSCDFSTRHQKLLTSWQLIQQCVPNLSAVQLLLQRIEGARVSVSQHIYVWKNTQRVRKSVLIKSGDSPFAKAAFVSVLIMCWQVNMQQLTLMSQQETRRF